MNIGKQLIKRLSHQTCDEVQYIVGSQIWHSVWRETTISLQNKVERDSFLKEVRIYIWVSMMS